MKSKLNASVLSEECVARQRSLKNKVASGATYVLDASAVVDDDDIERGVLAAVPAPEEVPADAAEPVDRHLELGLSGRPHRVLSGGLSLTG